MAIFFIFLNISHFIQFKMLFLAVVKDLPRSKFSLLCKLSIRGSRGEISMAQHKYVNIQPPIGLYRLCLATFEQLFKM